MPDLKMTLSLPALFFITFMPPAWGASCDLWLTRLGVTAENRAIWQSHPLALHILSQASEVAVKIESAPKEVLDLLSLAPHTSFLHRTSRDHLQNVFKANPILAELEIVLGQEVESLLPRLSTLFALQTMASPEGQSFFRSLDSSQYFILAAALNTIPKARFLTAPRDSLKGMQTLAALSRWGLPPQSPLLAMIRDNSYMTVNGVHSALIADQRLQRLQRERTNSRTRITAADEDMAEWIAERLLDHSEPPSSPPEWAEKLRRTRQILGTPLQDLPKYKGAVSLGLLVQYELFENLYHEVLDKWRETEGLSSDGVRTTTVSELVRSFLTIAFGDRLLTPGSGATLAMMTLFSMQLQFPLGAEIGRIVPTRIREQVVAGLKEYYGSIAIPPPSDTSPVPTSEDLNSLGKEMAVLESEPENASEVHEGPSEELNFLDLRPGVVFAITFKRVKSRFQGPQQIVFTEAALSGIRERVTKEVDPQSWMHALQMGIAAEHGQRGIKFLNHGQRINGSGIPIELKLLLSPWRVTGRYLDGVFIFENLKNSHR